MSTTTNYGWTKPTIGGDANQWGAKLNSAFDDIDADLKTVADAASSHAADVANPHGVTKAQVGLGNVENKSSATIRGEITSSNVTSALGYTPPTPTGTGASGSWNVNAATATALATVRTLWGQNFDGTGNVSGALSATGTVSATHATANENSASFRNTSSTGYGLYSKGGGGTSRYMLWIEDYAGGPQLVVDQSGNLTVGAGSSIDKFTVRNAGNVSAAIYCASSGAGANAALHLQSDAGGNWYLQTGDVTTGGLRLYDATAGAERLRIDTNGNLGLGVTPSALYSTHKLLEIGSTGNGIGSQGDDSILTNNLYRDAAGTWRLPRNLGGTLQLSVLGQTQWYTAAANGTNGAASLVNTMTLSASGNLTAIGSVSTGVFTVATLPAGAYGMRAFVTDATSASYASIVVGGGGNAVPVFFNGNWCVG
jgi:hypothetical protein